jgi:hypothetical protein
MSFAYQYEPLPIYQNMAGSLIVHERLFSLHYVSIHAHDNTWPSSWNFLGTAYKLQYVDDEPHIIDSRELHIDYPTLLRDWVDADGWKLGIKPANWLFYYKNIIDIVNPIVFTIGYMDI